MMNICMCIYMYMFIYICVYIYIDIYVYSYIALQCITLFYLILQHNAVCPMLCPPLPCPAGLA